MNFLTHIMISKRLYRYLSKEMYLDKFAFLYGNIKPDLSPQCLRNPHMLENYLLIVSNDSNRLIGNTSSVKEFSADLGVVCHYICDFFCYCHLNSRLYHKLAGHFFYELRLHLAYCSLLIRQKSKKEFTAKSKIAVHSCCRYPGRSVASMVMEMRKEYAAGRRTLQKDIEYALLASFWACQQISRLSQTAAEDSAAV